MSKSKLFSPARKEVGFTLIELLTVIVIIGILAAIAIPVFTSQRARAQDSQTVSDIRNIAVQAETIMSDPKSTYDDVTKDNIDFSSSKSVSWNISGSASLGGYCIVAKNPAGKKYTTDATALTYDSLAGGVGQTGKACSGTNLPVPNGSTAVGSDTVVSVTAPTSVTASRNSQTSATVNWTIPTDTTVTGYLVQRATTNNDAAFATVGTITSRSTSSFTDTSAPSTAAYYRLVSTTATGTSALKSTVATLSAYFVPTPVTWLASSNGRTGSAQSYTVTDTGLYKIEAFGAQGGNNSAGTFAGGKGAYATGTVALNAGQVVNFVVGQTGSPAFYSGYTGGGGGGTFVTLGTSTNATPLVVAGGGSGARTGAAGWAGQTSNNGTGTYGEDTTYGTNVGCSGAGFVSNGNSCGGGWGSATVAAQSYVNGSTGGYGIGPQAQYQGQGGYGGGAASSANGGGGGGGYTGGFGAYAYDTATASGGSYVIGSATNVETNNTTKAQSGNGKVIITRVG